MWESWFQLLSEAKNLPQTAPTVVTKNWAGQEKAGHRGRFDPTMHKNPRRLEQLDLRYKGRQVGPLFCKKTIENQKFLARVDALRIKVSVSPKKEKHIMRLEKILESWCRQESGIEEWKKPEVEENRLYQASVCLTFLDQQWLSCCALVKNDETKSDQENHPYSRMHWHNSVRKTWKMREIQLAATQK